MKSDNYVVVHGWMCNELNLKGNDLLIFALIYSYSRDDQSLCYSSLDTIADAFNISKPTVIKSIQNLLDKQYITKYINNDITKPNAYKYNADVVKKLYSSSKETLPPRSKETLPNKYISNKHNNTISKDIVEDFSFGTNKPKTKKPSMYDKCVSLIDEFTDDYILRNMLTESLKRFLENSREANKPFYTNHFKGKLNDLKKLSDDNYEQRKIVQQTLDKGWNGFYAVQKEEKRKKTGNFAKDVEHLSSLAERASEADKRGDNVGKKY